MFELLRSLQVRFFNSQSLEDRVLGERHTAQRAAAARQIVRARHRDRGLPGLPPMKRYDLRRSGDDYEYEAYGLGFFLDYVRQLGTPVVLDIGTGTSRGIHELSKSYRGRDLTFMATGLTRPKDVSHYIGNDRFKITSAEELRGIENGSVGGVIALHSIMHSNAVRLAICRISQVLVPGGVFKGNYTDPDHLARKNGYKDPNNSDNFTVAMDTFNDLGFDTGVSVGYTNNIVVAIKPPVKTTTARDIIKGDAATWKPSVYDEYWDFA